jgi:hypothetical protein
MTIGNITSTNLKIIAIVPFLIVAIGITEAFSQLDNLYRVQSLFLYNFTKHVKWERGSGERFTIGIYGNSAVFKEIKENLESKKVWGQDINIIEINSADEFSNCHIAYITKSNKKKTADLIDSANLHNTLVVTEDDMVDEGAAISFVFVQSRMNFKISKSKIEQAGLKVSNSLVSIGISV